MTNDPFKGSVQKMLATEDSVYHEPYVSVRLPFRVAEEMPTYFEAIHPAYFPYIHQQKAFDRLTGGNHYQFAKIAEELDTHYSELKKLQDSSVLINSLFALLSHSRTVKVGKLRTFLNVQV